MVTSVKESLNFDGEAAIDFLGPPDALGDYKTNIKDIITNTATFGQANFGSVFGWNVYLRCKDPENKCGRSPGRMAYTVNKLKNDPDGRDAKTVQEKRDVSLYQILN